MLICPCQFVFEIFISYVRKTHRQEVFAELDILLYCNTGSEQVKRAPGVLKKKKKKSKTSHTADARRKHVQNVAARRQKSTHTHKNKHA